MAEYSNALRLCACERKEEERDTLQRDNAFLQKRSEREGHNAQAGNVVSRVSIHTQLESIRAGILSGDKFRRDY